MVTESNANEHQALDRTASKDDALCISILVVSNEIYRRTLKLNLELQQHMIEHKLLIHTCKNVLDFLKFKPELDVEFVVFILDPRIITSVREMEKNLMHLNGTLLFGRTCIIEVDLQLGITSSSSAISALCKKYGLHFMVDNVMDPNKGIKLAERVLNLVITACGLKSAIPPYMVNPITRNVEDGHTRSLSTMY